MPSAAIRRTGCAALAAGGSLALAAGAFHYAALWPPSQVFGHSLIAGPDPTEIALTFDDGPNDPYTRQLIDLLAQHRVNGAFFVIGRYVRQRPEVVRALQQAGHTIGCHTMTHPRLMYMCRSQILAEVGDAKAAIEDTLGARIRFFRPPFGSRNPAMFDVLRELALTPVLWNVSSRDWSARTAAEIEQRLLNGIRRNQRRRRGSNLLLHDGSHVGFATDRSRTVSATATLLAWQAGSGMRFVTLDRWISEGTPSA